MFYSLLFIIIYELQYQIPFLYVALLLDLHNCYVNYATCKKI